MASDITEGCIVRHPGVRYNANAVKGVGRLYRVKSIYTEKIRDPVKGKVLIQTWAVLRSLKKPRWQIKDRVKYLTLVREAD